MKKKLVLDIIVSLFILLFIYAGVSKLLDYGNFRAELGKSPLLTAFAGFVAWFIPSLEILLAVMLAIPRTRMLALYGAFSLMVAFTAYIIAILQFSDYVPCSCGGVLEEMSWDTHLVFNIGFVVLGLVGILLQPGVRWKKTGAG